MNADEFKISVLPLKHKIYRFSLRMLGKIEEAEDSVQEVMLRLWNNREDLGKYKSIEAFAMVVTRNFCLDRLKSKNYHHASLNVLKENPVEGNPYTHVERLDTIEQVHRIIGQLPEQQKSVIHLRDIEGLEFEEIAIIMNMNLNAVRVNLSRARKHVRDTIIKMHNYELAGN